MPNGDQAHPPPAPSGGRSLVAGGSVLAVMAGTLTAAIVHDDPATRVTALVVLGVVAVTSIIAATVLAMPPNTRN